MHVGLRISDANANRYLYRRKKANQEIPVSLWQHHGHKQLKGAYKASIEYAYDDHKILPWLSGMLEEILDDPPLNVSCHVTAAVPPHDEHCPHIP